VTSRRTNADPAQAIIACAMTASASTPRVANQKQYKRIDRAADDNRSLIKNGRHLEMPSFDLPSWEAFEHKVQEIRDQAGSSSSQLLFRGQTDSEWPLLSTLDRSGGGGMLFSDYHRLICARVGPQVKTFADVEVPPYTPADSKKTFGSIELFSLGQFPVDLYRYMVYLRHHGFPSPLLDWSRSPYVAAFFAFKDDVHPNSEKRSIFAYCESPKGIKGGALGEPMIHAIGPYVQAHHRHFRQQCDYTICGLWDVSRESWALAQHQDVFDHRRPNQDFLWKFDIPSAERIKVLRSLNDHNLNAFSLFGSEESLMETMWLTEHVLKEQAATVAASNLR
jgi:FRG domain-containing protein